MVQSCWLLSRGQTRRVQQSHVQSCKSSTVRSIQLAGLRHASKRLNTAMHRHLRTLAMLIHELLVLLAPFSNLLIPPLKRISHIVVAFGQARTIGNGIGDECAVGLPEIDL